MLQRRMSRNNQLDRRRTRHRFAMEATEGLQEGGGVSCLKDSREVKLRAEEKPRDLPVNRSVMAFIRAVSAKL